MADKTVFNAFSNQAEPDFGTFAQHLLAEGDSWFAWSRLDFRPSSNILEALEFDRKTLIVNLAFTGDVIRNMGDSATNPGLGFELRGASYDGILLSGGGNDLIDALAAPGGAGPIIARPAAGAPDQPASYVNRPALDDLVNDIVQGYRHIIEQRAQSANRDTPIFLHTYDYPTARDAKATFMGKGASGPWLIKAMRAARVPLEHYVAITKIVYDTMADGLLALDDPPNRVHTVDTRNVLIPAKLGTKAVSGDWINEIHPTDAGYRKLARKWEDALAAAGIL